MRTTGDDQSDQAPEGVVSWLIRHEEHHFDRLDQLRKEESAIRAYDSARARIRWDEDRLLDAAELGDAISRRPGIIRARLARSKHGALWLIQQWEALGGLLESGPWSPAQASMAFDLLGIPRALRNGEPWTAVGLPSPRALVEREIEALRSELEATLNALDQFERAAAVDARPLSPSPAMLRHRREVATCWRRLFALQRQFNTESTKLLEFARLQERDESSPGHAPPPAPAAPRPNPAPASSSPPPSPAEASPSPISATTPISTPPPEPAPAPTPPGNRRARRAALRRLRQRQGSADQPAETSLPNSQTAGRRAGAAEARG